MKQFYIFIFVILFSLSTNAQYPAHMPADTIFKDTIRSKGRTYITMIIRGKYRWFPDEKDSPLGDYANVYQLVYYRKKLISKRLIESYATK